MFTNITPTPAPPVALFPAGHGARSNGIQGSVTFGGGHGFGNEVRENRVFPCFPQPVMPVFPQLPPVPMPFPVTPFVPRLPPGPPLCFRLETLLVQILEILRRQTPHFLLHHHHLIPNHVIGVGSID